MTKTTMVLCVLCALALGAAGGVLFALNRVAGELHRTAIAVDLLAARASAVEEDLAALSTEVASLAEDVGELADSLLDEEQAGEDGAVDAADRSAPRSFGVLRARPLSVRGERSRSAAGRSGSSPGSGRSAPPSADSGA